MAFALGQAAVSTELTAYYCRFSLGSSYFPIVEMCRPVVPVTLSTTTIAEIRASGANGANIDLYNAMFFAAAGVLGVLFLKKVFINWLLGPKE
ncbi:MAG: hypothetical protein V4614_11130 [Pseudomonadota bacterium]